jgi:hypothetical protein
MWGEGIAIYGARKRRGGEAGERKAWPPMKWMINAEENLL